MNTTRAANSTVDQATGIAELRKSAMMRHLLDALEAGTDVGEYGRLAFAMIARHFLSDDQIVGLLTDQPELDETKARALVMQVEQRGYNPPKREKILQWQAKQEFPICPDPENPGACNVYRELDLPESVFEQINQFWEERAASQGGSS